jgi:DNA-binding SARP family transcriptional activator
VKWHSERVRIGILGPLTVERDGRRLEVAGGRLKALLARLAVEVGQPVSAMRLADAIWDGELPADELHALQRALDPPSRGSCALL